MRTVPETSALVIEDDASIAEAMRFHLERAGVHVRYAPDGLDGLKAIRERLPDVVVLDLMLPGMDGWGLIRELRSWSRDLPIIVVTGRSAENDRIEALRLGADDVMIKPFSMRELVARVMRARRWVDRVDASATITQGCIELDTMRLTASVAGRQLDLTPLEFGVLRLLLENAGTALARDVIYDLLWSGPRPTTSRVIDAVICRLREKLGGAGGESRCVRTVRGVGYVFEGGASGAGVRGDPDADGTGERPPHRRGQQARRERDVGLNG